MAKNKSKNKGKQSTKSAPKKNGNGTMHTRQQETFEASEEHESEAAESEETEAAESEETATGQMDEGEVRRIYPLVLKAEQDIAARVKELEASKARSSALVLQLRTALGGGGGPFLINGQRFQIRVKADYGFRVKENPRALQNLDIPVEGELSDEVAAQ